MIPQTSHNSARPPFLLSAVRRQPHLYSAICKARMFYSRQIAGAAMGDVFRRHDALFALNDFENEQMHSMQEHGYALIGGFFAEELVDSIYAKADQLFRELQIDTLRAYSVQSKERDSLAGLSYEQLAKSEKMIALRDPLIQIPEVLSIAFHESVLKIAAHFLGYVPPLYRVTVVRDFPHNRPLHSSNFHKDNDESDSLQIFVYLVDIDDTRGPLVYVPGSNHYDVRSCRPRLARDLGISANDGRMSDEEVQRIYPRNTWATLRTKRGSVAMIHGNGIHKGPAWGVPGSPLNLPRTAIKLDLHGYKTGVVRTLRENKIREEDYQSMSGLQKLFAHADLVADADRTIQQAS
jgi:ectoine hydroxylase-related dioxygenase (phytanoyl-CoA dioxygenase family)